MRLPALFCAAFLALFHGQAATAQNSPVVIELYTSQGCSSCPPADALLTELGTRSDVIAMAFHVDYWDYLGWKDDFASPEFTRRQKAYAHSGHRRTVFTPELVIQGRDSVVGHKRDKILAAIAFNAAVSPRALLVAQSSSGTLTLSIRPNGAAAPQADVILVRYLPDTEVMINRGENAGRTVHYSHIVGSVTRLGTWDGATEQTLQVENINSPAAVIVQTLNHGPILAAARIDR